MPNDYFNQHVRALYLYAGVSIPRRILTCSHVTHDHINWFPMFMEAIRKNLIDIPPSVVRDILSIYNLRRCTYLEITSYLDLILYLRQAIGFCSCYYGNDTDHLLYRILAMYAHPYTKVTYNQPVVSLTIDHDQGHLDDMDVRSASCYELIAQFLHATGLTRHLGGIEDAQLTPRGIACYRIYYYAHHLQRMDRLKRSKSTCDQ
nr:MAG TPA: hypothetical protein [Bacteriophage sp.]